jgi:hypothetical protein
VGFDVKKLNDLRYDPEDDSKKQHYFSQFYLVSVGITAETFTGKKTVFLGYYYYLFTELSYS